ncbi:MAG: hypothetical protein Ct9H300mP1_28970 [Planctomycetaceae bacterium]|nr:MAG: hypothetical protein Ct9H300mP1_28970 [Planctomycetaceae bacterium]
MCLPSVTGDGLLPLALRCLPLTPGPPLVVFQTVLPDRSTASVVFLPASWDVRMICPFQMIGSKSLAGQLDLPRHVLGRTPVDRIGSLGSDTVERRAPPVGPVVRRDGRGDQESSPKTIARILIENSIG